ncbi:MAG: hypothetical protein A2751_02535 [Candidatus Doudnabacteria bacterium RIFCSPHIGHO2_01_FULL_46_14]|uniref:Uncharacterized protein n=1 Tax=Candidatus Doudnabacteria bacterium RIFCSPHIGHO2_01_FULL_46_14 TaxID=1817824 RepID=A0A1F5NJV7_9BACT|nr:MAG: hypothetical protein A2751_02535 [Candidatus Doudnabacteria bacterium RIFCSPHIGHO2_01_FULL_46_14]
MSIGLGEFLIGTMPAEQYQLLDWQTKRSEPVPGFESFVWVFAQIDEAGLKQVNVFDFPIHDPFLPKETQI